MCSIDRSIDFGAYSNAELVDLGRVSMCVGDAKSTIIVYCIPSGWSCDALHAWAWAGQGHGH